MIDPPAGYPLSHGFHFATAESILERHPSSWQELG
jgi:hypothetical protein